MKRQDDKSLMQRCLELANQGFPLTSPNPLVGSLIVKDGEILSEGFHVKYGEAHAERNALQKLAGSDLSNATLYVNLEPCSHYGKTPPCVNAILEAGIKKVVVGTIDPNPKVSGKGIEVLKSAGVEVAVGILEAECRELNKRFFTFHERKRPYVILKWAESADGFLGYIGKRTQLTGLEAQKLNHQWRSEEQAIVIGTNTALIDDPELTVRLVDGKNPLRVVFDKNLKIPKTHKIFNSVAETLVISEYQNSIDTLFTHLYERKIISCIIEGGATLLKSFIERGLWDEARVFVSPVKLGTGIMSPMLPFQNTAITVGIDKLFIIKA